MNKSDLALGSVASLTCHDYSLYPDPKGGEPLSKIDMKCVCIGGEAEWIHVKDNKTVEGCSPNLCRNHNDCRLGCLLFYLL